MPVQQSMCRDLFTAFMAWLGFLPRDEVEAAYVPRDVVDRDFLPHDNVKAAYVPRDVVERDFLPRARVKARYQPLPIQWWTARFNNGSSITRVWNAEDVPLCDLCRDRPCAAKAFGDTGETGICVIVTDKVLEDTDAGLFARKAPEKPVK